MTSLQDKVDLKDIDGDGKGNKVKFSPSCMYPFTKEG